ncbi:MAG: hypothetical protein P1P64_06725 [Treponemataceae bacterium]
MKKILMLFYLFLAVSFASCTGNKESSKSTEFEKKDANFENLALYVPNDGEIGTFVGFQVLLHDWEIGERYLSDEKLAELYSTHISNNKFSSMIVEQFFKNTKNKKIQEQVKNYILKNNLNSKYEQALLKKFEATEKFNDMNGNKVLVYSYNDRLFDENINLFDFSEIILFEDELGMLLFDNDWSSLAFNSSKDKPADKNKIMLLCGGGTNSLKVKIEVIENIKTEEDIKNTFNSSFYSEQYPDNWKVIEMKKEGILKRSGADRYFVGMGTDIGTEGYSSATFNAYLYSKKRNKVYKISYFMNFSSGNISYEIRQRIYDYLQFFTLLCYVND